MRVAIVAPVDPIVERPGGTRTYVMSLVRSLERAKIDFSLIGMDFDGSDGSPSFDFIPAVTASKVSSVKFLRGLMKVAKKTRFSDDTIIHAQRPDYLFPFIFRKHQNKKLCTLHGQVLRSVGERKGGFYGRAYGLLESYSIKRTDCVLAMDRITRDMFIARHPVISEKISLIPAGIDIEDWGTGDWASSRREFDLSDSHRVALYVGRLEKEKRVDMIIESVRHVRDQVKEFSLIIVGDGSLRGELESLAEAVAPGTVSFMGAQPRSVVRRIMTAADVLCLASNFESAPMVVLESLAAGTPVVSTDAGIVREFIPDQNTGRIVPQESEAIGMAIVDVLKADRTQISSECVRRAKEFSFEKTFEKTLEVYEDLSRKCE
jgi:glycosyltransferase involved in cell wall biosynthesis